MTITTWPHYSLLKHIRCLIGTLKERRIPSQNDVIHHHIVHVRISNERGHIMWGLNVLLRMPKHRNKFHDFYFTMTLSFLFQTKVNILLIRLVWLLTLNSCHKSDFLSSLYNVGTVLLPYEFAILKKALISWESIWEIVECYQSQAPDSSATEFTFEPHAVRSKENTTAMEPSLHKLTLISEIIKFKLNKIISFVRRLTLSHRGSSLFPSHCKRHSQKTRLYKKKSNQKTIDLSIINTLKENHKIEFTTVASAIR